jgi:lambda repressor-like predicted transcriptional regulator
MSKKAQINQTWTWFVAKYEKRGYASLNQFALATGLQKSSLSRYFHLQRQIPSGMMATLCRELKVSPNELMKALGQEWN